MTTDEAAIQNIVTQLETAWNAQDSTAFAAPFAEDANFIHMFGGQLDGRPAIEASHRQIFNAARQVEARPTLIVARAQGSWEIVAFQNTKISEMPAAAPAAGSLAT